MDMDRRRFCFSRVRDRTGRKGTETWDLIRSMVMAYGQDDRVCAFTSLFAMLDVEAADRTACCILVDKEEIGSVGATGMHSRFFENAVAEIVALTWVRLLILK